MGREQELVTKHLVGSGLTYANKGTCHYRIPSETIRELRRIKCLSLLKGIEQALNMERDTEISF